MNTTPTSKDPLSDLDPRARILCAASLCSGTAFADHPVAILLAILITLCFGGVYGFPFHSLLLASLRLNALFVLMALLTVPFVGGDSWITVGPLAVTRPGAQLVGMMVLRGNALVLSVAVCLSTMETAALGHAMGRLRVPPKFVRLFMSVIRYIDVLLDEHRRMRMAMRARGFRPQLNRLTMETNAAAVGALLVRSLDRAERVSRAMQCRGHHGVYAAVHSLIWTHRDSMLTSGAMLLAVWMLWIG